MAYSEEEKKQYFDSIVRKISLGSPIRNAILESKISSQTVYKWIEEDDLKSKQYARATESRADFLFDQILDIADDSSDDTISGENGEKKMNSEFVQRSRLRVDARKWYLSKLNPKKYGDKQQIEATNTNMNVEVSVEEARAIAKAISDDL